jgi:biopolymer transport protein TolR
MPRGRGHRAALEEIGTELNLVPYLDMMTVLVLFLLVTITSFLSFTMLNASIPQLSPDSAQAKEDIQKKQQLLLMVRVTSKGYMVDPNVQGGASMGRINIPKNGEQFGFEELSKSLLPIKQKFPEETRVLIIAEPRIAYDDIIHTMDAIRESKKLDGTKQETPDLFPDVTLSIF